MSNEEPQDSSRITYHVSRSEGEGSGPAPEPPKIIGLVCERSVPLNGLLDGDSRLKELPNVRLLTFPCSGMIKPQLVELALNKGADGVFICGCATGDCHYREGNLFIRERIQRLRPPNLRHSTDPDRIGMMWKALPEAGQFLERVREFQARVAAMPRMKEILNARASQSTRRKRDKSE
jgi:F420-non-reducing hydrogenase iron-sulfur subunit